MRIGYDLDVNSSHVEREFTTYKLRCFYQRTPGNFSQHLRRKHPNVRHEIQMPSTTTPRETFPNKNIHLNRKANASMEDKELSKIDNSMP